MEDLFYTSYTRASTDRQEVSVADQLKVIGLDAEVKRQVLVDHGKYSDDGFSGTTFERRKGVMALINDVKGGRNTAMHKGRLVRWTRVKIYDESRWGRPEDAEDSTYFELELKRHGVLIEYVHGNNQGGIVGRITRDIKYDQASEFSKKLGVDVVRGSKGVVELGYSPGGFPPIGYVRMLYDAVGNPLQVLQPGERKAIRNQKIRWVPGDQAPLVRRIFSLAVTKSIVSIKNILDREGVPSPDGSRWKITTILYILKNRSYLGERSYGGTKFSKRLQEKIVCPIAHEPIIDRDLWDTVQSSMEKRGVGKRGNYRKSNYLLTSKLVCKICGYNFSGRQISCGSRKKLGGEKYRYRYYMCRGHYAYSLCPSLLIPSGPIETFVIDAIKKIISSEDYKEAAIKHLDSFKLERGAAEARIKTLLAEIKALDKEISRIQDELLKIPSKSLRVRLIDRERRREVIENQIKATEAVPKPSVMAGSIQKYFEMIANLGNIIMTSPIEKQKEIIGYFLKMGEVDRKKMEVKFYFYPLPSGSGITYPLRLPPSQVAGDPDHSEAAYKLFVFKL